MSTDFTHRLGDAQGDSPVVGECLWTVREAATYLRLHPKTLLRRVGPDRIPCRRIGARLRFDPVELRRWFSAQGKGGR